MIYKIYEIKNFLNKFSSFNCDIRNIIVCDKEKFEIKYYSRRLLTRKKN